MNYLSPTKMEFISFILIFARVSGLFFAAPIFSARNVPQRVKLGLAFFLAIIIMPFIEIPPIDERLVYLTISIGKELMVGLIIGYIPNLIFSGILIAAKTIDFMMGFGIANVIDPITNIQVSVIGQFQYILALIFFLVINGHHLLFTALSQSFTILPLGAFTVSGALVENITRFFSDIFVISVKIGAPAIGALFMANLVLGIIARTMPQMNVFIVGIPLNIGVGFAILVITMPFFFYYLSSVIRGIPLEILGALR
ncbi:MAG: flagellar biosynthetic protein FliR [Actinomycetota bacterium]|nr:flagellar biosynthetic protein FliR [Actinomycetota bacterium]